MGRIPNISNERLASLVARIKPVVRFARAGARHLRHDDGDLYYIAPVDPRWVAFTWDPKPTKRATGLRKLDDITTYHTYGYHGFFKPSIAEVLAQIPAELVEQVVAFETSTDVGLDSIVGDYHATTTTLYTHCRRGGSHRASSRRD